MKLNFSILKKYKKNFFQCLLKYNFFIFLFKKYFFYIGSVVNEYEKITITTESWLLKLFRLYSMFSYCVTLFCNIVHWIFLSIFLFYWKISLLKEKRKTFFHHTVDCVLFKWKWKIEWNFDSRIVRFLTFSLLNEIHVDGKLCVKRITRHGWISWNLVNFFNLIERKLIV